MPFSAEGQATLSLEQLCAQLVECERVIHRYQWASGLIIHTLFSNPETPKLIPDFVDWLAKHTGIMLAQAEVTRRLTVFKCYSRYSDDPDVVRLIEVGGVKIAHEARKVINGDTDPEHVRTVLQACVDNPGAMKETLQQFRQTPARTYRKLTAPKIPESTPMHASVHQRLQRAVRAIDGTSFVPLQLVLQVLDELSIEKDQ